MLRLSNKLPQKATLWPTTPSGFGGVSFSAPVLVACRWEDKSTVFVNRMSGKEEVSRAEIHIDTDAEVGDWIAPGDQTTVPDPSAISEAFPIRAFISVPDLRSLLRVRKVII